MITAEEQRMQLPDLAIKCLQKIPLYLSLLEHC